MSLGSAILLGLGGFLLLYAIFSFIRPGDETGTGKARPLGCGFTVLAGVIWGIALAGYLGWSSGLRLGIALACLLPVLVTLFHPKRRSLVTALVLLSIALVLGVPVLPQLGALFGPSGGTAGTLRDLERKLAELERRLDAGTELRRSLADQSRALHEDIRALGHADYETLVAHPEAHALLKELAEVESLVAANDKNELRLTQESDALAAALRRLGRLAESEAATGETLAPADVEAILEGARSSAPEAGPRTVEEHMEAANMRELFEREFGDKRWSGR